jgi:hypothetical protein
MLLPLKQLLTQLQFDEPTHRAITFPKPAALPNCRACRVSLASLAAPPPAELLRAFVGVIQTKVRVKEI